MVSELNVKFSNLTANAQDIKNYLGNVEFKMYSENMINYKEVLTYSDQPVTCPKCGNRTEVILDLSHTLEETQVQKCLSHSCRNQFVTQGYSL